MNISATTNNTLSTLSTKTDDDTAAAKTASLISAAANPLNKVTQRLQTDADSTKAQLSSFGLFKSAVSTLQLAARKLGSLSATSTESDVTTAAANLFNTFNAAITAAQKTATGGAQSAASASRNLQRAVRADPALSDAMRKLGMTVQSDGSLQHDAQKFASALKADPAGVTSALKKIGQQLDTVADKELATTGKVSLAMTALNQRSSALAAQQQALSAILQSSQSKMGLSAYLANSGF